MVALAATPAANANTQIQKYFIETFPLFGSIQRGRGHAIGEGMIAVAATPRQICAVFVVPIVARLPPCRETCHEPKQNDSRG
jgi:hypothetical protein